MSEHYECDQCGLCCEKMIIEAEHYDALREPRIAKDCRTVDRGLNKSLDEAAWLIACGPQSPCPYGSRDGDGLHVCDIYATRPHVCLTFLPGGSQCQEWRRNGGLPELVPLDESEVTLRHRMAALCGEDE